MDVRSRAASTLEGTQCKAIAVVLLLLCLSPAVLSQQMGFNVRTDLTGGGYWVDWESVPPRLIFHRDADSPNLPAIKVADASGKVTSLYPVRDLTGSTYIDVWAVAGAPNGDIVISAMLAYGPRNTKPPVRAMLLTYDSSGTLREVWEVDPYLHHDLAVDSDGNIFALGHAYNQKDGYPLIVKYSPYGEVLKEFLPDTSFPKKDLVVMASTPRAETHMLVKNNKLNLYLATTEEFLIFSLDGALLSRASISGALRSIQESTGSATINTYSIGVDSSQNLLMEVGMFYKDRSIPPTAALAKIAPDGSFKGMTHLMGTKDQRRFLGLSTSDAPVYMELMPDGSLVADIAKQYEMP